MSTDRRALASVAAQFFVNGAIVASFVPRLPEVRDRIGVDLATLGALLAAASLVGIGASVALGSLTERFGSRRLLLGAGAVLVAALPVIGFATLPVVFLIALAVMSSMDVLVDATMNMQASWLSHRRNTPVMNRLHGLWSLGTVVGGAAAAWLAALAVPLRYHLVGVAVLMGLVLIYVGRGLLRDDEPQEPADTGAGWRAVPWRPLVTIGVLAACSIAMEMTSSDWAAFRLSDDLAASAGVAGLGYVAFTTGMTTGRLSGDWVLVRIGEQRLLRLGLVTTVVGLVVVVSTPRVALVIAGFLLAGAGIATQFPALYDRAVRTPGRRGAGLGALTAASRIALVVAPLVVGAVADRVSVGAAVAIVTLPAAAVFAALTWRAPTRPADTGSGV